MMAVPAALNKKNLLCKYWRLFGVSVVPKSTLESKAKQPNRAMPAESGLEDGGYDVKELERWEEKRRSDLREANSTGACLIANGFSFEWIRQLLNTKGNSRYLRYDWRQLSLPGKPTDKWTSTPQNTCTEH